MDEKLKKDIQIELENLERLVKEMQNFINRINEEPEFVISRTTGSILHDFYCGIEKIFGRIAINVDNNVPKGEDWHMKLLLQMAQSKKDRKAIIDSDFLQDLKEFLRFRHLFRNIYGFQLKWDKIKPLCVRLDNVYNKLKLSLAKILK